MQHTPEYSKPAFRLVQKYAADEKREGAQHPVIRLLDMGCVQSLCFFFCEEFNGVFVFIFKAQHPVIL